MCLSEEFSMPQKTCPGKSLSYQFLISILTLVKKIRYQINFIVFLLIVCLLPIFWLNLFVSFFANCISFFFGSIYLCHLANCMLIFSARSICVFLLIACLQIFWPAETWQGLFPMSLCPIGASANILIRLISPLIS